MLMQQPDHAYQEFARTVDLRPDDFRARLAMANLLIVRRNLGPAKEQTDLLLKQRPADPAVHSAIASLLAAQQDIPGAIRETQQTIALAPGRWESYLSLALLQLKNGQADAAEATFKKVIELDPKEVQARVLLGSYYQSAGRAADAEQQFRTAITIAPGSMAPREALAKLFMVEGKKSDAQNTLEQANRELPNNPDCLLALSNFYYLTGDVDKAVSEYNALYQVRPNDLGVKKKYIELLIQTKRYDQAKNLNDEILKASAGDSDAMVFRSEMQISGGDVNDAVQTLQTVVQNAPSDSQAHYVLGIALNKQGFSERAESEWRKALNLNPDYLDAERALADKAMLDGDMNALQDAANQVIRLAPDSAEGYALRALSNINLNQFDAAERDVKRAIAAAPQNAFGYVELGNLKFAQKQYGDAAKAYQDALDRNAASADALRGLMNTYVQNKQPDKAIEAAKTQIGKVPENSSFYDLLGAGLFHFMKDYSGAQAALEKAIALDAHNTDAVIQLCQVQATQGQIDGAIATGEQFLKQNPRQASVFIVVGDLYAAKSDWKAAETAYQNAVAINSLNPVASNDLAGAMLHTGGSLDVAMSLVQAARRQLPASPAIADTMGWIYYQKGEYQLALSSLQEALNLASKSKMPDNADIHYHLGMAYLKTKQPTLARQNLEQVLKTSPNYRSADEIKEELDKLKS
jgi:tetratricopeptide (TPR) repeat protein